jgi:hypothetical protein
MQSKRAYFANTIKNDRFIYIIGGRGDSNLLVLEEFVRSQYTLERYDIDTNKMMTLNVFL